MQENVWATIYTLGYEKIHSKQSGCRDQVKITEYLTATNIFNLKIISGKRLG